MATIGIRVPRNTQTSLTRTVAARVSLQLLQSMLEELRALANEKIVPYRSLVRSHAVVIRSGICTCCGAPPSPRPRA